MQSIYRQFGISEQVLDYARPVLEALEERFKEIDETAEYNQLRIIKAMQDAHIGEANLKGTTGYGYDDIGRDGLERVYASYFHTEDALVRPQITCGTHALALALMSNLRPGQVLLSAAGAPYDTLQEVIGIRPSRGSLAEYGIGYRQVDLLPDSTFDFEGIRKALEDPAIHLVTIQRSKGYQDRRTLSVSQIGEAISVIKKQRPDVICMVDNCYGEFVERQEPSDVGADMIVGSLIKNPGGGLAPIGGYIAGTAECVENAAVRLTSPGLGKEVGATLDILPAFYQGFFMGPTVTASALKGAILAANLYEPLEEPMEGLKDNGQYVITEIKYSENYPNSFLDITRSLVYIRNVPLYIAAVLACSIPAALLFRWIRLRINVPGKTQSVPPADQSRM